MSGGAGSDGPGQPGPPWGNVPPWEREQPWEDDDRQYWEGAQPPASDAPGVANEPPAPPAQPTYHAAAPPPGEGPPAEGYPPSEPGPPDPSQRVFPAGQPDYGQPPDPVVPAEPTQHAQSGGEPDYGQGQPGFGQGQPDFGQGWPAGQPEYGQPDYGQGWSTGQPDYGQPDYGQGWSTGQPDYGQPDYGQGWPAGQPDYGPAYPGGQAGYGDQSTYGDPGYYGQPTYGDQPPPGGFGVGGGQPPYDGGKPPKSGGMKPLVIVVIVVVAVLLVGGVTATGVAVVQANDPSPSPSPTPSKSSAVPSYTSPTPDSTLSSAGEALPERINERSADPAPLTLGELFPKTYKSQSGKTYTRYATKLYKDCDDAVIGTKLKNRLSSGNCTQVAAGTYVDKKSKVVGTIGLANLTDISASTKVKTAVDPPENIVFKPLDGRSPAKITSKSFFQRADTVGHYTQWNAMTYTNRSPSKSGKHLKLLLAMGDLEEMIDEPLSDRMIKASP